MSAKTPQSKHGVLKATTPNSDRKFRSRIASVMMRPHSNLRASAMNKSMASSVRPSPARSDNRDSPSVAPSTRPTSRDSSKENMAPQDATEYEAQRRQVEALKAELHTLRYTIANAESERELEKLQYERDLRELQRRADEDFKKKQGAEGERDRAERAAKGLAAELEELRAQGETTKIELEKRARAAEDEARRMVENLEEAQLATEEALRTAQRDRVLHQSQVATLESTVQEVQHETDARETLLQESREQLAANEQILTDLEGEVLRLKAQVGDAESMPVIRRQLSDQMQHMRTLEATNQAQSTELEHLRQTRKAVQIVEDEKSSLQRKLDAAQEWQVELAEERRQRQRLEDERLAWSTFLQREARGGEVEFDSPEAVARALLQERLNSASLLEKLGALQPEVAERDRTIQTMEEEKSTLLAQLDQAKAASISSSTDKARQRLDRQRALAEKEVEYLRAQLRTFDSEDMTFQPENFDASRAARIKELEDIIDKYKGEVQALHVELSSLSSTSEPRTGTITATSPLKRLRDENDTEAESNPLLGQLARKNRKLQDDLSTLQKTTTLLKVELDATTSQLTAAKAASQTRVLQLRSNPTSDHQNLSAATLAELRLENDHLRASLLSSTTNPTAPTKPSFPTIPASTLAVVQRSLTASQAETASARKSALRLKEVFASKSAEFKEAIFSTLGWHVTFIPNGKMRVESVFHPSLTDEHENSIVFDGERGTMKVGGGPKSAFAGRIGNNVKYWVREKGCIPGFLASLTLEFYDEMSEAGKVDG